MDSVARSLRSQHRFNLTARNAWVAAGTRKNRASESSDTGALNIRIGSGSTSTRRETVGNGIETLCQKVHNGVAIATLAQNPYYITGKNPRS